MDRATLLLGIMNRLLDPVGSGLSIESAQKLVNPRADETVKDRVRELAEKCNEGTLSVEERAEYEACVMAANSVAILQAKARTRLESPSC